MGKVKANITIDYVVWQEAKSQFDNVSGIVERFLREALDMKNDDLPKTEKELKKELEKQITLTTKLKEKIKRIEDEQPKVLREW